MLLDETLDQGQREQALSAERTYAIIGAAMEVHSELGHGFLEPIYQDALEEELRARNIPYVREGVLTVLYKGKPLRSTYKFDFLCYESVVVELKALSRMSDRELSQVMNYLKATGLARGLLLNFGAPRLEYRRALWAAHLKPSVASVTSVDRTAL